MPKEVKLGTFLAVLCISLCAIFAAVDFALWYGAGIAIDKLIAIVPMTLGLGISFAVKPGSAVFTQESLSGSFIRDMWNVATRSERTVWIIGGGVGLVAGVVAWYALKAYLS